jgi:hypothetical protein
VFESGAGREKRSRSRYRELGGMRAKYGEKCIDKMNEMPHNIKNWRKSWMILIITF